MSRLRDGIDGLSDTDLPDSSERQFNRAGLNETIKEKCLKVCCRLSDGSGTRNPGFGFWK